jgi:hypothetical protein
MSIVIGQNQRRLPRFAFGCHVSLIRQSHAAAASGFGLSLLIAKLWITTPSFGVKR